MAEPRAPSLPTYVKENGEALNLNGIEYKFLRASELRVPARIDHFLVHFGQSTRKELFGSVREASSTQALLMINWAEKNLFVEDSGILFTVGQREGDDKIKTLFKGTLSRLPSEKELRAMKELAANSGKLRLPGHPLGARQFHRIQELAVRKCYQISTIRKHAELS